MMWGDILLSAVAALAGLLFIVGSIQAFQVPRSATRHRRKKTRRRRRKPAKARTVETLPPRVESAGNGTPGQPGSMLVPTPAVTLAAREVAWSGRPPAGAAVAEITDVVEPASVELGHGKVVVHYADGKILKGFSQDFYANKPSFHLLPSVAGFSFTEEVVEVRMKELKAVFFVRDFVGDSLYNERKHFVQGEHPPGRKVQVTFPDGEMLVGSTVGYDRRRQGFFLIPADPQSNNRSIFILSAAATSVRFL